ncbi:hypothetical protein FGB62_178g032 [Gracilaria domingensis]|nr:hypothetical protein FGB62_178g032 [Gracilaria domingensis]
MLASICTCRKRLRQSQEAQQSTLRFCRSTMNGNKARAYSPWPVPDQSECPSIRDDVRRTIYDYAFKPSTTHYTRVYDIYKIYLYQTKQSHSAQLHERFRSTLGRVLHPPHSAGEYALSYKADISRWREYISLVSPQCECINMKHAIRQLKRDNAVRRIERAKHSEDVARLREIRRVRKEQRCEQDDQATPQLLSFRYVDEFLALNCAEDLTRLKVRLSCFPPEHNACKSRQQHLCHVQIQKL